MSRAAASAPAVRGFSLVELMVALALGLFLVGVCTTLLLGQLEAQRRLVMGARLTQELRHAADLMARDLRRAGYWAEAPEGLWRLDMGANGTGSSITPALAANPYSALLPAQGSDTSLAYSYDRRVGDTSVQAAERFGWRINSTTRALELRLAGGSLALRDNDNWQAITDATAVRMRSLVVRTELLRVSSGARCARSLCADGSTACLPTTALRLVSLTLEASAQADPNLIRSVSQSVRVRSDATDGACPA